MRLYLAFNTHIDNLHLSLYYGLKCVKFSHNNCAAEAHNNCEGFTTQPGHPE